MTTAVYIRTSTIEQNEASQVREIKRWLAGNGIEVPKSLWFVDKETGDNLDRPAFKRLQSAVFNGEVKCIVCWRLDRLSRKLRDGINTLADWLDKGVRLVSTTQQLDFSGLTGQLVASVLFAVAQMEQQTRRERQAAGIAAAKERKVYKGRKPGAVKVDPARVLALHNKGLSIPEIKTALSCSRASVYRALATAPAVVA
jgi:DNA invertase Pin-like site-specific DNA recombinase